jgi:hypothetical protein
VIEIVAIATLEEDRMHLVERFLVPLDKIEPALPIDVPNRSGPSSQGKISEIGVLDSDLHTNPVADRKIGQSHQLPLLPRFVLSFLLPHGNVSLASC